MAESQVPYPYGPAQFQAIRLSLSEPRFGAYLTKGGGDVGYALALYLYNARLAKAFLFPLHVVEVTMRNAMDGMLVSRFGVTWHDDARLRQQVLTAQGLATLDKAVVRAGQGASRSQVVAELTFDFWSNLLRPDYGDLWRTDLRTVFPDLPRSSSRHDVQLMAKAVNRLRNRVAHHEPILDENAPDIQSAIFELIGYRCAETAAWTRHHTTVGVILRTRPRGAGSAAATLSTRLAPDFVTATTSTAISTVVNDLARSKPAVVVVDDGGAPIAAFTALDVTRFVAVDAARHDGLFAVGERTVGDLIAEQGLGGRWSAMFEDEPLGLAIDALRGPNVDVLVGVRREDGAPSGVVVRAHRRY